MRKLRLLHYACANQSSLYLSPVDTLSRLDSAIMSSMETEEESQTMEANKRKRRSYDPTFKLEVISYAEAHNKTQAAKHYGIHRRCVQTWAQRKEKLEEVNSKRTKLAGNEGEAKGVEKTIRANTHGQLLTALPVTCASTGIDDVIIDTVVNICTLMR